MEIMIILGISVINSIGLVLVLIGVGNVNAKTDDLMEETYRIGEHYE